MVRAITAGEYPKAAKTVSLTLENLNRGSHVLLFCVYRETQKELRRVIAEATQRVEQNGCRVEAPDHRANPAPTPA